ncbi:hypothetical protein LTR56_025143 [Elasticomyces elasticus]|nr:hypothetical protein LTR56_025143 [Elasticomyces elasticus]KAK4904874.1 hypothetical protein LTR49_025765 [Elasticomyces elasticus]KAK5741028.1 hypothetical protein LTS12_024748 [Elasticomyces elasticus]
MEQALVLRQKSLDRKHITAMITTPSSSRLLALPPEIRNDIWDLAFSGFVLQREVDISYTNPPNKSLLLSNRQIFNEAKGFFSIRYLEYWKLTRFSITYNCVNNNAAINIPNKALASIRHVSVSIGRDDLYGGFLGSLRFYSTQGTRSLLIVQKKRIPDTIIFRRREDGTWWSESVHQLEDDELHLVGGSGVLVVTVGGNGKIRCCCPAELQGSRQTSVALTNLELNILAGITGT